MLSSIKISNMQTGINRMIEVSKTPEQPVVSFNRICFGLMNNDWVLVASSSFKLLITLALVFQVFGNKSI